jgi:hypothetical protein
MPIGPATAVAVAKIKRKLQQADQALGTEHPGRLLTEMRQPPISGKSYFHSSRKRPSFSCATRSEKKNRKQSSITLKERLAR